MEVLNGVVLHAVGASCAALCYTPQKKVVRWSWQTYWLAQAAICWLLLPVVGAWLTIPRLQQVLAEAPADVMVRTFLLGAAYGVGGTCFGMAIRHIGLSLTYAIAVGISCVLGTLLPPLVQGQMSALLGSQGAGWVFSGIAMGAVGIALCGIAGRYKETDLQGGAAARNFSLAKGLPLCFLAGVLSAVYGFSLAEGQPIADAAARYGAGDFQVNAVYLFANTGAFLSTLLYCLYLHRRNSTFTEYGASGGAGVSRNYLLAILTGFLWYGQFFFYGLGHVRMGAYKFSSWAIHMIMLVLFSAVAGIALREWKDSRPRTARMLALALLVLVAAVLVLSYGNYLGAA